MSKNNEKQLTKLKDMLIDGSVHFTYTKVDGSERKAFGTLKLDDSVKASIKGNGHVIPDSIFVYYDLGSEGWRSFRKSNFIMIDEQTKKD